MELETRMSVSDDRENSECSADLRSGRISALEELKKFCQEDKCIGALLLTGGWGCGKTWLIEQKLKPAVEKTSILIRVSLFGLSTAEEIHNAVKKAYIDVALAEKGISKVANAVSAVKSRISSVHEMLPDVLQKATSIDIMPLFEVEDVVGGKRLILVFDDLERCKANMVDVFGVINEYCENRKIRTIIVANEEKIDKGDQNSVTALEAQVLSLNQSEAVEGGDPAQLLQPNRLDGREQVQNDEQGAEASMRMRILLTLPKRKATDSLPYAEIKEKMIQRTVRFRPSGAATIESVLDSLGDMTEAGSSAVEYMSFVKRQKDALAEMLSNEEKSVNLRSLKCAVMDYARVYEVLKKAGIEDQKLWFLNFVSYLMDVKSGTVREEKQRNYYVPDGVKLWVMQGIWDEKGILAEARMRQEREQGEKPADIIRLNSIADLDEELIQKGWQNFLADAYTGRITLDDYVQLLNNSCWCKKHHVVLPCEIDWEKITKGVSLCIQYMEEESDKEEEESGRIVAKQLDESSHTFLTEEEQKVYRTVLEYRESGALQHNKNRLNYIARMQSDPMSAFLLGRDRMFEVFSFDMAKATEKAFENLSNADKSIFVKEFRSMWLNTASLSETRSDESRVGFLQLREALKKLKDNYVKDGKNISAVHTEQLISAVNEILEKYVPDVAQMTESQTLISEVADTVLTNAECSDAIHLEKGSFNMSQIYTKEELNSLRYYQGDIEKLSLSSEKPELTEFYQVCNAYEVLNTLLYPGISNEEARIINEKRNLSPILLDHMDEVLNIYENMLSAIHKYTKQKAEEGPENQNVIETVRFDRENSLQFLESGETCAFMSTTRGVNLEYFKRKSGLVLEEIVAEPGTPCIDLYEVLGKNSKYDYEKEVLFPPFLKLDMEVLKLSEEERTYKDMNGNPPVGKWRIHMRRPEDSLATENAEETGQLKLSLGTTGSNENVTSAARRIDSMEHTMNEIRESILEGRQIQNAKVIWKNMENGRNLEEEAVCLYVNWKEQISRYVRAVNQRIYNLTATGAEPEVVKFM